mmetsp:Transcript_103331/g.287765  ORF Transcript_103331/g.287765 Transcript_103331/m.287765 type:complete len:206 (-) Transcript_103331:8-625(-)
MPRWAPTTVRCGPTPAARTSARRRTRPPGGPHARRRWRSTTCCPRTPPCPLSSRAARRKGSNPRRRGRRGARPPSLSSCSGSSARRTAKASPRSSVGKPSSSRCACRSEGPASSPPALGARRPRTPRAGPSSSTLGRPGPPRSPQRGRRQCRQRRPLWRLRCRWLSRTRAPPRGAPAPASPQAWLERAPGYRDPSRRKHSRSGGS